MSIRSLWSPVEYCLGIGAFAAGHIFNPDAQGRTWKGRCWLVCRSNDIYALHECFVCGHFDNQFADAFKLDPQGPLWFRGFARWTDEEGGPAIDRLAAVHGVDAFICSHSPNARDGIRMRFDDRVFLIDTGMLKSVYDGFASALEIRDGRFTAIYPDRELVLIDPGADAER